MDNREVRVEHDGCPETIEGNEAINEQTPALVTPEAWRPYLRDYGKSWAEDCDVHRLVELGLEDEPDPWLGAEPAGEDVVAAAEQRLGVRFPPSFRGFLLTSDGWHGVFGWIDEVHSCADVHWLRDISTGRNLIKLYSEGAAEDDEYATLLRQSLAVAKGEDLWLLDPTDTGADGEWAAWEFQIKYGDFGRYGSFAELFHASRR